MKQMVDKILQAHELGSRQLPARDAHCAPAAIRKLSGVPRMHQNIYDDIVCIARILGIHRDPECAIVESRLQIHICLKHGGINSQCAVQYAEIALIHSCSIFNADAAWQTFANVFDQQIVAIAAGFHCYEESPGAGCNFEAIYAPFQTVVNIMAAASDH